MAVTVRTLPDAKAEGLHIPDWLAGEDDDFVVGHDNDDGKLLVWGPGWDRAEAERLAKAYD